MIRTIAASLTLATAFCSFATAQIPWSDSLAAALERAAADNTIVMIALSMPGERGSDVLEESHYKDALLGKLGKHSANLIFRVGPNGEFHPDERIVRERYLGAGADTSVAVPHHLFVKPVGEGELISSVAYQLTEGQLEWIWVDAIRTVNPEFEWELSDGARAPERMKKGGVEPGDSAPEPPTEAEVEHALAEIKKSGRGGRRGGGGMNWMSSLEHLGVILRSDDDDALKWATNTLRSYGSAITTRIVRVIGEYSPQVWWTVVTPYLEDRDATAREESARALERLAAKKSLSPIKKQLRGEKEDVVRGRLVRALAAVAPADRTVATTLGKILEKDKSTDVRVQAAAAISVLESPEVVEEHLRVALADRSEQVRSAAAFAIASRRDKGLLPLLDEATLRERNLEAKQWLTEAKNAIESGELEAFHPFMKDVLGDRIRRERLDLESLLQRAGRGGRGDGGDGGDGDGEPDGGGAPDGDGRRRGP